MNFILIVVLGFVGLILVLNGSEIIKALNQANWKTIIALLGVLVFFAYLCR